MIAEAVRHMLASGMPPEAIVQAVADMEKALMLSLTSTPVRSAAAERQARYRDRKTSQGITKASQSVTRDVTRDASPSPLSPHPDKETAPLHPPKENNPSLFPPDPRTPSVSKETSGPPAFWFDDFWRMYPNKVGKPDAIRAFRKAMLKVDVATLMVGLRRYVAKQDDRPWCNPATWLNQERWADEPQVSQQRQPKGLEWFDEAARWIEDHEQRGTETGFGGDQDDALGPPQLTISHRPGHG